MANSHLFWATNSTQMSDWQQLQNDEAEALTYILEDRLQIQPRVGAQPLKLAITVVDDNFDRSNPHYCPLIVNISLPANYPQSLAAVPQLTFDYELLPNPQCRELTLTSHWLPVEQEAVARAKIASMYQEAGGEAVVYEFYEWLRGFVEFPSRTEVRYAEDKNVPKARQIEYSAKDDEDDDDATVIANNASSGSVLHYINRLRAGTVKVSSKTLAEHGIISAEPFSVRKSTFQGHLVRVNSMQDIFDAFAVFYGDKAIARATHNIFAYCVSAGGADIRGYDDDGETAAGNRMAKVLDAFEAPGVLVVVSRWFGGVLLGPSRFKYINQACQQVLEQCGYARKRK